MENELKKRGRVIGIISFKGGVGKTVSSINIASALNKLNKKTIVIDSNFSSPNLHVYMGLLNPEITLREVLRNNLNIDKAIYEHENGLHIIPCHFYNKIDLKRFKEKISELKDNYDFIIIDSSPTLNEEMVAVLMVADEIIMVSTPDYPTLLSTLRAADIARYKDLSVRGVLVNKKRNKSYELSNKDIEDTVNIPIIGSIKDDHKMMEAVSKFKPIVNHSPKNKNSKIYLKIAASLTGEEIKKGNLSKIFSGIKKLFGKKDVRISLKKN